MQARGEDSARETTVNNNTHENPPGAIRLLVAGAGPIPCERPDRLHAPGIRIEGFARALADAGHPVRLVTCRPFSSPEDRTRDSLFVRDFDPTVRDARDLPDDPRAGPVREAVVSAGRAGWSAALAREVADFGAAAAVSSTDLMNLHLARSGVPIPLWFDYFGDPTAERQLLAFAAGSDEGLHDQWRAMAPALARGDRFSGCSFRQIGALEGELATLGRLNRHTSAGRLVEHVGPWHDPAPLRSDSAEPPIVRGVRVPADAFIILQTGGFNTWLDVDTLLAALDKVMEREPRVHFVATGGSIPGHHSAAFARFESGVRASRFRDRYHLTGWLPLDQVPRLIAECDLGLNVDLPCAEGWLGTRNRLLDWIAGGLAVVSTLGCELAADLDARGAIRVVGQRDPEALAAALLDLARDETARRRMAAAGRAALRDSFHPARCLAPLLAWARDPRRASDLAAWESDPDSRPALGLGLGPGAGGRADAAARIEELLREKRRLENRIRALNGSRLVRLAMKFSHAARRVDRSPPSD